MTKPIIKIVDAATGQEIEREFNAAEMAQHKIDQKSHEDAKAEEAAKAEAKAALLERLGITAEEAQLLLG
jgi:hypothetical protein